MTTARQKTVIAYVDGFNLYYGMIYAKYTKLKWLDLRALSQRLVGHDQVVIEVIYFTSLIDIPKDKRIRQLAYVNALATHSKCNIVKGSYVRDNVICEKCGHMHIFHSEKMTDVNIATRLIIDSVERKSDIALIISGDSDLVPAIIASKKICLERKIFVRFPPERHSNHIAKLADDCYVIGKAKFRASQLPESIPRIGLPALTKPVEWR